MLHTVNKSPFSNSALENCLRFVSPGDVILLLEDAVYGSVTGTAKSSLVEEALKKNKICAIQADLKARALTNVIPGIEIVGYDTFVDLVEQHTMHAWL